MRTCGASLTRDLGVKFGLHLSLLGLSNMSENEGLNCRNFTIGFRQVLSSEFCQRALSALTFGTQVTILNRVLKLLYICWRVYTVNVWYCTKLKAFSNEK